MFKNIGRKYKILAWLIFIVTFAMFLLCGVMMIITGIQAGSGAAIIAVGNTFYDANGITLIIIGAVMIVIGFLVAWIGSWFWYGLGQAIDNTDKMVAMQNEMINRLGGILQQQQDQINLLANRVDAAPSYAAEDNAVTEDVPVTPSDIPEQ